MLIGIKLSRLCMVFSKAHNWSFRTFTITERFRSSLVSKRYLNDKIYPFFGMEAAEETVKYGAPPNLSRLE